MSVGTSSVALKKLAFAKQIFQRAIIHSNSLSNVDRLMAVIEFDLVTESVLNTIVKSLDPTKTPADGFPSLLNQVDAILNSSRLGTTPDRANIVHVHNIRNGAQHDARYPNPSELSDCHTYTRDFLKKIIQLVWNLDFDKVSLTDLIQHQKIQSHLKNAEVALQASDYKTTAEQSVTGLQKALNSVGRSLVGSSVVFTKIMVADVFGRDPKPDENVGKTITRMQDTLRLMSLGLNYLEYMKFKEITGTPLFSLGNENPMEFVNAKTQLTQDDAEFVLSYAIDSVIMIENKVGNIEKPFGKDFFQWI